MKNRARFNMIHIIPTFNITPNIKSKGWTLKHYTDEIEEDLDKTVSLDYPFSFKDIKQLLPKHLQ